jgi:hypothetical protein
MSNEPSKTNGQVSLASFPLFLILASTLTSTTAQLHPTPVCLRRSVPVFTRFDVILSSRLKLVKLAALELG